MSDGPDLLVGIDVGMSCTGISFLNKAKGLRSVQIFKDWGPYRVEDKVPTRLVYPEDSQKPSSWGFNREADEQGDVKEWFKLDFENQNLSRAAQDEARRLYRDYLTCIYEQLRSYFAPTLLNGKQWSDATVQFYFSVPTTWETHTVDVFCKLAGEAGFDSQPRFEVKASLTEPHAVAAYTLSREGVGKDGESILIIDAGGGTVDLCFFTIEDARRGRVSMTEIAPVLGSAYGSTFIDSAFQGIAQGRLRSIEHLLDSEIEDVAWQMMRSYAFQDNKKDLGSGKWEDDQTFQIKIPCLKERVTDASLRLKNGEMQFTWSELREIFDVQIIGITKLMNQVMDQHSKSANTRFKKVDHVVLSGGLGSSKYVQQQIQAHMDRSKLKVLSEAKLHQSSEAQLSVCHGILEFAIQSQETSTMFPSRRSRSSLGIPCRIRCKSTIIRNTKQLQRLAEEQDKIVKDENGQRWIEGYMDWFVKLGDQILDSKSVEYRFSVEFDSNVEQPRRIVHIPIMTSLARDIPKFKDKHVQQHSTLRADLSQVSSSSIARKSNIFGRKKPVIRIHFLIEAVVGLADVSFKCLDVETKKQISDDGEAIPLEIEEDFEATAPTHLIREEHA